MCWASLLWQERTNKARASRLAGAATARVGDARLDQRGAGRETSTGVCCEHTEPLMVGRFVLCGQACRSASGFAGRDGVGCHSRSKNRLYREREKEGAVGGSQVSWRVERGRNVVERGRNVVVRGGKSSKPARFSLVVDNIIAQRKGAHPSALRGACTI